MRFVTKGTNQQQIIESCVDIHKSINCPTLNKRAEWRVEVLSDNLIDMGPATDHVTQIVVPEAYQTTHHSLFKARALHYAASHYQVDQDAWILHMDEES